MNIDEIQKLITIEEFPVKGSAILSYFIENGEISGCFYIGIIESSGKKTFKIRWADGTCEILTSLEGRSNYYKYYAVLGYISYEEYMQYGSTEYELNTIDGISNLTSEPDERCIKKYKKQAVEIQNIKHNNKLKPRTDINEIGEGRKIKFIYAQGLKPPLIVEGYTRLKDGDNDIYVNCDINLNYTDNEDDFYLVKKALVLEC